MESTTSSFVEGTAFIELAGVQSSYKGGGIAKLYPNKRLKGYYGNYTIRIRASDRGYPSNSATAQYSICIQVSHFLRYFSPLDMHYSKVYDCSIT